MVIGVLFSVGILANSQNKNEVQLNRYNVDTIPKSTDSSYAQKQSAFYQDSTVTSHFDTLTSNGAFRQMDSVTAAKLKADSLQKTSHPVKKKKHV